MAEIKYFSPTNAGTFAEEIKRLYATKASLESLSLAVLLMANVHDTIIGQVEALQNENSTINSAIENHDGRISALENNSGTGDGTPSTPSKVTWGAITGTLDLQTDLIDYISNAIADKENLPTEVTSPSTSLTPEENTIYKYTSPLTSLSIGHLNSSLETLIYFTAASSGCTLSVNSSYDVIGVLTVHAGKKYVISILNGVLIMGEIG